MSKTKKRPSAKNTWGFTEEVMAMRRRAIADPVRQQILDVMIRGSQEDWTARELAAELGLGMNGLYYHLRFLEEAQLAQVGGERLVARGAERSYKPASDQGLTWELNEELVAVLQGNLERAKRDVAELVYEMARRVEEKDNPERWSAPDVNGPQFTTTHEEIDSLRKDLRDLVDRYRARAKAAIDGLPVEDRRTLRLTYALRELPAH